MGALRADEQKLLDAPVTTSADKPLDTPKHNTTETPDQPLDAPTTHTHYITDQWLNVH